MDLKSARIALLIESDYYEKEIFYYESRFREEGIELCFMSRLWGNPSLEFIGHEYKIPLMCNNSFENLSDEQLNSYNAIIVPAGYVADRLRYTEDVNSIPPATQFMERAFNHPGIIKGIICHGMWLMAPSAGVVRGRSAVVHNNLLGDARNMGINYVDRDVVVDGDLVTARTGGHCHLFARKIIELLKER